MKAKIYKMAMDDYENNKIANSTYREPISKTTYENLIEAEALMKKLDRRFRQVTKFHSRYIIT